MEPGTTNPPAERLSSGPAPICEALDIGVRRGDDPASAIHCRFEQSYVLIGRDPDCHIHLDDPSVAPRQVYLQQLPGRILAIDLSGADRNGRADARGIPQRDPVRVLPPGVTLQVGPVQVWHSAPAPIDREIIPRALEDPLPPFSEPLAFWEVLNARGYLLSRKARHLRHELTLVGQGPSCRIRVVHDTIREIHASLVCFQNQLQVIDLTGRSGVHVNGRPVSRAALKDGDELKIGRSRGVIHLFGPVDSSPELAGTEFVPRPAPSRASTDDREEGIVVSLPPERSAAPNPALTQAMNPGDRAAGTKFGGCSNEFVQTLAAEFLKMQRTLLDQTQTLMHIVNERLEQAQAAAGDGTDPLPGDSTTAAPRRHASRPFPPDERGLVPTWSESFPAPEPVPEEAPADEETPLSASSPELHAWLARQLAGLESEQETRFSRLWQRWARSE